MRSARWLSEALSVVAAALSLFLVSCAGTDGLYTAVDSHITRGEYREAITLLRENRSAYGEKNSVLYNLDIGLLYHYAGEGDSSSAYLFAAEKEIDDLYTRSISLEALSYILNDNVIPYEGEDFEKVLINVFIALNYAERGMDEDALVEARKVDLKLRQLTKAYEGKNKYQEDAFIRYLAAILYENEGEVNDAFISYRNAFETYKVYEKEYGTQAPAFLLDDLVRTASELSFDEEVEYYHSLGGRFSTPVGAERGRVLVIVYAGQGPIKTETRPTVSIPDSSGTLHTFQIALPSFVSRYTKNRFYDVSSTHDSSFCRTSVAENITAIGRKSLDDRLALVYLKSGGRALAKFLAAEKSKSELSKGGGSTVKNFLGSLAIDLVIGATEQADIRTWRTLPSEIQLARLTLPPGEHVLQVASSDGLFRAADIVVQVRNGATSLVVVDDVR